MVGDNEDLLGLMACMVEFYERYQRSFRHELPDMIEAMREALRKNKKQSKSALQEGEGEK